MREDIERQEEGREGRREEERQETLLLCEVGERERRRQEYEVLLKFPLYSF